MTRLVVTLYDHPDEARRVVDELHKAGFDDSQVEYLEHHPEDRDVLHRIFRSQDRHEALKAEKTRRFLTKMGIPESHAQHYAQELRSGRSLVIVQTDEEISGRAKQIMSGAPIRETDVETSYGDHDVTIHPTGDEAESPPPGPASSDETATKRQPSGFQVRSDREADARFELYEPQFRRHYEQHYAAFGEFPYDDYRRAYRYGMELAEADDVRDRLWPDVADEAARHWEGQMGLPWRKFREAVRYGWYQLRGEDEQYGRTPRR